MAAPSTKKPTRKTVHSSSALNGSAEITGTPGAAPAGKAATVKPAKPGAARAKSADPTQVEVVGVSAEHKPKRVMKKEKVVRDSFTMPKSDYAKIAALKQKCLDAGVAVKKSELLRAGLLLLEAEPLDRMLEAMVAVETVKTGRPAKHARHDAAE